MTYQNVGDDGLINNEKRCPHCSNSGYVYLDGTYQTPNGATYERGGAPCPNCRVGQIKGAAEYWRKHPNPAQESWNGGITLKHAVCFNCDTWTTNLRAHRQQCQGKAAA